MNYQAPGSTPIRREQCSAIAAQAMELGQEIESRSDQELLTRSQSLMRRRRDAVAHERLLPEALALFGEGVRRSGGRPPGELELTAAVAACLGTLAELPRGEDTSNAAAATAYWYSLMGDGVHVVTCTEHDAVLQALTMTRAAALLGGLVGLVTDSSSRDQRQKAYAADMTYACYRRLLFDYLRDNLHDTLANVVQRKRSVAVVNDADLILIDRPCEHAVITGPMGIRTPQTTLAVSALRMGEHYEYDGEGNVAFSRQGIGILRGMVADLWPGSAAIATARQIADAIRRRDNISTTRDRKVIATTTVHGYFRGYRNLVGLTSTAGAGAVEFDDLYGLRSIAVGEAGHPPTIHHPDVVYGSGDARFEGLMKRVVVEHARGRPVVIGTTMSALVSPICKALDARHIKYRCATSEQEPAALAHAGQRGAVTVLNVTDIRPARIALGGDPYLLALESLHGRSNAPLETLVQEWTNVHPVGTDARESAREVEREEMKESGGLAIFGVGREASRRACDWLAGLAGPSGEVGEVWFLLAMTDPLLAGLDSRPTRILRRFGLNRVEVANRDNSSGRFLKRLIEDGQRSADAAARERLRRDVDLDSVVEEQREQIYSLRGQVMKLEDARPIFDGFIENVVSHWLVAGNDEGSLGDLLADLGVRDVPKHLATEGERGRVSDRAVAAVGQAYSEREREIGVDELRRLGRRIVLSVVDSKWSDYLSEVAFLRAHVHVLFSDNAGAAEYRSDAAKRFAELVKAIELDSLRYLFQMEV